MFTVKNLIASEAFQSLTPEDKEQSLNMFYDHEIKNGRASEIDRAVTTTGFRLKHLQNTETERRKPIVDGRYDALAQLHNDTTGKSDEESALPYQKFLTRMTIFDQQEKMENENMRKDRELLMKIYSGDEDEVSKTKSERGVWKGHILGGAMEVLELGKEAIVGGTKEDGTEISWSDDDPVTRRRKLADKARETLKERGHSEDKINDLVDELRADLQPFPDDYLDDGGMMRVNSFGEIVFNPEALARTVPSAIVREIKNLDAPDAAKERAIGRLTNEQWEAAYDMSSSTGIEVPRMGPEGDRKHIGDDFFIETDEYLNSEAGRLAISKFSEASAKRLGRPYWVWLLERPLFFWALKLLAQIMFQAGSIVVILSI